MKHTVSTLLLLCLIANSTSQTVYSLEYESNDLECLGSPFRYSIWNETCSYGITALECNPTTKKASLKTCNGCKLNATCNTPLQFVTEKCSGGTFTSCSQQRLPTINSGIVSYVSYRESTCTSEESAFLYYQTKNKCVDELEDYECLLDGTGVKYTKYTDGSKCSEKLATISYPFGPCVRIPGGGNRYYRFTGCVTSSVSPIHVFGATILIIAMMIIDVLTLRQKSQ